MLELTPNTTKFIISSNDAVDSVLNTLAALQLGDNPQDPNRRSWRRETESARIGEAKGYVEELFNIHHRTREQVASMILANNLLLRDLFAELKADDEDLVKLLRAGESGNIMFSFTHTTPDQLTECLTCTFGETVVNRAAAVTYVPSPFTCFTLNKEATGLHDLVELRPSEAPNSCGPQAIIDTYKLAWQSYVTRHPKSRKLCTRLDCHTYEAFFGREWDGVSSIATTPSEMGAFVNNYGVGLSVHDVHGELLYEALPCNATTILNPKTLHLIYHDQHVEPAAVGVPTSAGTVSKTLGAHPFALVGTQVHRLRRATLVSSVGEVVPYVRAVLNQPHSGDAVYTEFVLNGGSLLQAIGELRKNGMVPYVVSQHGLDITSISLRKLRAGPSGPLFTVTVLVPCKVHGESGLHFGGQEELDVYDK